MKFTLIFSLRHCLQSVVNEWLLTHSLRIKIQGSPSFYLFNSAPVSWRAHTGLKCQHRDREPARGTSVIAKLLVRGKEQRGAHATGLAWGPPVRKLQPYTPRALTNIPGLLKSPCPQCSQRRGVAGVSVKLEAESVSRVSSTLRPGPVPRRAS